MSVPAPFLGRAALLALCAAVAAGAAEPPPTPSRNPVDGAELVAIPAGTFTMGYDFGLSLIHI